MIIRPTTLAACFSALALTTLHSAPLSAKEKEGAAPPALYVKLAACRALSDPAARLSCFDDAAAKLDAAVASKDLYMIDRAQVRETRRTLFGLSLPNLGLFGGDKDDETAAANEITQIDSTLKSVSSNANGWVITLEEGSTWQQIDGEMLALRPKPGMKIVVKKGALGSFKMAIGPQPSIKVKRIF
ncbi:MAG: hypothetical protein ABL918_03325 [Chakrabartia sp.]